MKKFYFLFSFFFLITILVGCSNNNNNTSNINDVIFNFEYHLTPGTKPGMGNKGTTLTIINNDVHLFRDYPANEELDKKFVISSDQKEKLIYFVKSTNFFSLNDNYNQDGCNDGKVETLSIEINNEKKSIYVYCEDIKTVEEIKNKILELLKTELGIKSWSGF